MHTTPRRTLRLFLWAALVPLGLAAPAGSAAQAPAVAAADLSRLSPADFADEELDLPYYLAHFHRLANSVRMEGEDRGFIDLAVWRRPKDNRPYNARVMENILSLAFFYATDRPWNPYRGDPALRARLEAALDFWVRSQSPEGQFSEYGEQRWSLAPTAFATKFMGETLRLLRDGPPIDPALHRRVVQADRRAIMAVLGDSALYRHGVSYSNQYGNVWPGALAYLSLYPDAELERLLRAQLERARSDHQSPAGYYYEQDGPDWGYNLGTHHSNVHMAWHYARGTALGRALEAETRRWYEWFAYNAVPDPGEPGLTLNRGIETRQRRPTVTAAGQVAIFSGHEGSAAGFPLAEQVELARILGPTREALDRARARQRADLERSWPRVDPLLVGEFSDVTGGFSAYSPYAFLHRNHVQWFPSASHREEALARLPFIARGRFVHQRMDARHPVVFTYVRRPAYYAAFNSGALLTRQQRYGLGLLWTPGAGSLLQSQTATREAAWGTVAAGDSLVHEARSFEAGFRAAEQIVAPAAGNRDLPDGELSISYALGSAGEKTVSFADDRIRVAVRHRGAFREQVPLLVLPDDRMAERPGEIMLQRGDIRLTLRFDPAAPVQVRRTEHRVGARQVVVVFLPGRDALDYELLIHSAVPSAMAPIPFDINQKEQKR